MLLFVITIEVVVKLIGPERVVLEVFAFLECKLYM
jgi:hypothetical protein